MTTTRSRRAHPDASRHVDPASLALFIAGLVCGVVAYFLIMYNDANALLLVPAIVAATVGLSHLTTWRAPRDK